MLVMKRSIYLVDCALESSQEIMSCFRTVILELRCLGYCILACFSLLFIYIINIGSRPWKPKDRPNEPECLSDPKYGVHKIASVNVNPMN